MEADASKKQFNIRYSCATNAYERYTKESGEQIEVSETLKTWQSCAYQWRNIIRKEERDWKMVYLARDEDADNAEIEWKFDFSDRQLRIKNVKLIFDTKTFESGKIDVLISHNGKMMNSKEKKIFNFIRLIIKTNNLQQILGKTLPNIQNVLNLDSFSLRVKLEGGNGDCAWQHTQLFRQSSSSSNEYPFMLEITFH